VWNASSCRYEHLPFIHHSASYPMMTHTGRYYTREDPYGTMFQSQHPQFQQNQSNQFPQNQSNQFPQNQSNLGFSSLWTAACNLAENFIVQFVCDQTKPSAENVSAETLAKSKLNPNAKEFRPMNETKLVDQTEICSEKVTSMTILDQEARPSKPSELLQRTEERTSSVKAMPGVTSSLSSSSDMSDVHGSFEGRVASEMVDEDMKGISIPRIRAITSSISGSSPATDSGSIESSLRSRSISDSSEDSFVQFKAGDDSDCDKVDDNILDDDDDDDDSDDESLEDHADDWDDDWDNDDRPGHCIELSAEYSELMNPRNISCPTFQSSPLSSATAVEGHPDAKPCSEDELRQRLSDVNRRWAEQCCSALVVRTGGRKTVCWTEETEWLVVFEPEELQLDLRRARESEFLQMRADEDRDRRRRMEETGQRLN